MMVVMVMGHGAGDHHRPADRCRAGPVTDGVGGPPRGRHVARRRRAMGCVSHRAVNGGVAGLGLHHLLGSRHRRAGMIVVMMMVVVVVVMIVDDPVRPRPGRAVGLGQLESFESIGDRLQQLTEALRRRHGGHGARIGRAACRQGRSRAGCEKGCWFHRGVPRHDDVGRGNAPVELRLRSRTIRRPRVGAHHAVRIARAPSRAT